MSSHSLLTEELLAFDKEHIWHPYTSTTNPLPVFPVESASGCKIKLKDGKELIDGMSSWWAVIHGYNHPKLNKAIIEQTQKMAHVMFGGLTHEPAVSLAQKLIEITPDPLEKVFFCDSGSVSVEVAMKMAIQYQHAKGRVDKTQFATIRSGYHGDTWHAMSTCDPQTGMHHIFKGSLPIQHFAEQPQCRFNDKWNPDDFTSMKNIIEANHNKLAAVILEPIVQGAGGMWFYHPQYLVELKALCEANNILLIADEIATGFGRTGKLFACEHSNISPDILCVGKAITGGYLSFAATLATNEVATTISNGEAGVFMHGPTFMGNPLACAVANASIELLLSYDWQKQIQQIEKQLQLELNTCKSLAIVEEVRVIGAIGVVELKEAVNMKKAQALFVENGIWVRPFGKMVYLMPPFIISKEELSSLTSGIYRVLQELYNDSI